MPGIVEPIIVVAVRGLPAALKENLRGHLLKSTPIVTGHASDYVTADGAACIAVLAAYPDVPRRRLTYRDEIPEPVHHAYWIMARAVGDVIPPTENGLAFFVRAEWKLDEEDLIASIEEGLK